MPESYGSFLIRVWLATEPEEGAAWAAEVESVHTGERWSFTELEPLMDFLRHRFALKGDLSPAPAQPP
ncbi:MAG TPA: hypothetical protein VFI11_07520 [Anaerolineales bacterium]|nr:hypothetical protein [Anaerolineales bacterium]